MAKHGLSRTNSNRRFSRRSFLKSSAAAGAVTLGFPAIVRGQNLNELLDIAIIGAGGRGIGNFTGVQTENIVALCDVNQKGIDAALPRAPKASTFTDYRKLYDHANDFDAVVISICEHTHAFATLPAEAARRAYEYARRDPGIPSIRPAAPAGERGRQ